MGKGLRSVIGTHVDLVVFLMSNCQITSVSLMVAVPDRLKVWMVLVSSVDELMKVMETMRGFEPVIWLIELMMRNGWIMTVGSYGFCGLTVVCGGAARLKKMLGDE